MKIKTLIVQNEKILLERKGYFHLRNMIESARSSDIQGRLEIHYEIKIHKKIIYSLLFINENNVITGHIFPHTKEGA